MPAGSSPLAGSSRISNSGFVHQRLGQPQPLGIAQRQCAGTPVGVLRQPKPFDSPINRCGRYAGPRVGASLPDFGARSGLDTRWRSRPDSQPTPTAGCAVRPTCLPSTVASPPCRLDHAQQHANGGGLARAVEAEKGVDLAAADPQRQAIDRGYIAVLLAQVVGRNGLIHCSYHTFLFVERFTTDCASKKNKLSRGWTQINADEKSYLSASICGYS